MNTFVMRKQAYFIKQFILQGILQSNPVPVNNNNWNSGALVSAAVACLVILMGGLEGKTILNDFNQNTDTLNTSTDLAQNQLQTTLETVSIQPVPLVASAALNPKELASLKPGNISNQRKEDRV
jgi:hypothetical protein